VYTHKKGHAWRVSSGEEGEDASKMMGENWCHCGEKMWGILGHLLFLFRHFRNPPPSLTVLDILNIFVDLFSLTPLYTSCLFPFPIEN
jgi:hypothetical protein